MSKLSTRAATATIFVIVMLVGMYGGSYTFVVLFAIITALCLWEFFEIVLEHQTIQDRVRVIMGIGLGITPFLMCSILNLGWIQEREVIVLYVSLLFFPVLFLLFLFELFAMSNRPFTNIAFLVLGILYIGIPFTLLNLVAFQNNHYYANIAFGILLLTWMSDTGAYVVGSSYGRTPLFPRISPKKTWEGTLGGIAWTVIVAYFISLIFRELQLFDWLVVAAIVSVFAPLGDLTESMLKRSVKVKDSGSLLPGHGGFLDRFDAFIFLLPFATAYILWIR